MPVYNAAAYIQNAVYSVIGQTYINWELLIVNDGSTDKSEGKIKSVKDERIRYFYQTNQGVSAARNKALKHMRGDFFCFLDADDAYPKDSLEVRLTAFKKDPEIAFVDGQVLIMDHKLTHIIKTKSHTFRGNPFNALVQLDESCFFGPSWMIKRNLGVNYKFKEGLTHCEDLLFYISISQYGGKYTAVTNPVLKYRQGHHSAMRNLKGLENGYLQLYQVLVEDIQLNEKGLQALKYKLRSIMWKSYLVSWSPLRALLAYIKFSRL
jgi:glycosyltransferase involved in cell wall biosynthesis